MHNAMPSSNQIVSSAPRVVIFMTALRGPDIPAGDNSLACLLPLGTATFAERVMDSCAQAGLREIDLVVSEQPERLRERLGDGSQWGLHLNWHLSKETATPYAVLQSLHLKSGQRLLIGHGHRWLGARVLQSLIAQDSVATHLDPSACWTGWLSVDSLAAQQISPHADFEVLSSTVANRSARQVLIARQNAFASADSASELMRAQQMILQDIEGDTLPASWLRRPWGAMSPDAVVDPLARIVGPVLIGAGCVVARSAQIGPGTVLSRNVMVTDGAAVLNSLILPNTYVGGRISLDHAVAQGNSVQSLKWSLRTTLPQGDAMLTPLVEQPEQGSAWSGRLLALILAVAMAPAYLLLMVFQAMRGRPLGWLSLSAVTRRSETGNQLDFCTVRLQRDGAGKADWLIGAYGALLDVVQGRRNWFGVRPRDASQWYALGHDWQILFGRTALGLLHAPAWTDPSHAVDKEALAAADVYLAVNTSARQRWVILLALLKSCLRRSAA